MPSIPVLACAQPVESGPLALSPLNTHQWESGGSSLSWQDLGHGQLHKCRGQHHAFAVHTGVHRSIVVCNWRKKEKEYNSNMWLLLLSSAIHPKCKLNMKLKLLLIQKKVAYGSIRHIFTLPHYFFLINHAFIFNSFFKRLDFFWKRIIRFPDQIAQGDGSETHLWPVLSKSVALSPKHILSLRN